MVRTDRHSVEILLLASHRKKFFFSGRRHSLQLQDGVEHSGLGVADEEVVPVRPVREGLQARNLLLAGVMLT